MIKFDEIELGTQTVYTANLGNMFNNDYLAELTNDWQQQEDIEIQHKSNHNGGWQGHLLHRVKSGKEFLAVFQLSMLNLASQCNVDNITYTRIYSWCNVNPPGSYNTRHHHRTKSLGPTLAGVYYVKVPKNSGCIIFYDQEEISDQVKVIRHSPTEGELLLFNDNVEHSVEENNSTENRISIAFNFM